MTDRNLLAPWVRRFLLEHLVAERNFARCTQMSYRDALALLLPFVSRRCGVPVDRLSIDELSPVTVRRFLDHVEQERHCSVSTRNQRLGAIHSLARFIGFPSTGTFVLVCGNALCSLQEDCQDNNRISGEIRVGRSATGARSAHDTRSSRPRTSLVLVQHGGSSG
jgi:Phage integrase, N-terminal SAM-like domain